MNKKKSNTKKQTKYITYSGNLLLAGVNNDYLIYYINSLYDYGFKLYKQNLNNASDKNILLSSKSYVMFQLLGEKNIYIKSIDNLMSININTGKLEFLNKQKSPLPTCVLSE